MAFHRSTAAREAGPAAVEELDRVRPRDSRCDAFPRVPALQWIYVTIGGIGLAFYLYREFLARHFASLHDYQVEHVELFEDGMMEISLRPLGAPMHFVPGQFAMLYLEAAPGWRRHPFLIASPPSSDVLRFTVKAPATTRRRCASRFSPACPP